MTSDFRTALFLFSSSPSHKSDLRKHRSVLRSKWRYAWYRRLLREVWEDVFKPVVSNMPHSFSPCGSAPSHSGHRTRDGRRHRLRKEPDLVTIEPQRICSRRPIRWSTTSSCRCGGTASNRSSRSMRPKADASPRGLGGQRGDAGTRRLAIHGWTRRNDKSPSEKIQWLRATGWLRSTASRSEACPA